MANLSELTRKDQVAAVLKEHLGLWVDGTALANEQVGGSEGLKRLRELRQDLAREGSRYAIQQRKHPDPSRAIYQYRMVEQTTAFGQPSPVWAPKQQEVPRERMDTRPPDRRSDPAPKPSPPAQGGGGFWGSHATDRHSGRKTWREWKPAKKAPGTLECVFWIGKQRVIGGIAPLGPDKWGWGVVVPGSTKRMTRERRIDHGIRPDKEAAREAVEACIEQLRESGEYR